MTEQTRRERVEAWIDEAGEEPTAFGKAVIEIGRDQGFPLLAEDVSYLELEERHEVALIDHMDGVDRRDQEDADFVQAVAFALGLDPANAADYKPCRNLAYSHLFKEPYGV